MQVHLLARLRDPLGHRISVQGRAPTARALAEAALRLLRLSRDAVRLLERKPLPAVLDEAQEFLLAVLPWRGHRDGAPAACPRRTGGFPGNPSPPGEGYLAFSTMSRKPTLEVAPMAWNFGVTYGTTARTSPSS
jgi:hypothetical protein